MDQARDRLTTDAQKRDEKVQAIKKFIEAEKKKFVDTINERLETMIKEVVVTKVKERVKAQVGFNTETHQRISLTPPC